MDYILYICLLQVWFPSDDLLVRVHSMVKWDFAYRQARRGDWEQYARDRDRFSTKIAQLTPILSPILDPQHRDQVYLKYFLDLN